MTKAEELLKVLDLPEEEQIDKLKPFVKKSDWAALHWNYHLSLADLAFRLRNQARLLPTWENACIQVFAYSANGEWQEYLEAGDPAKFLYGDWFLHYGQLIHIIIAALIAKALEA